MRKTPKLGDLVSIELKGAPILTGWVARDDMVVGPATNALLVYVLKPAFREPATAFASSGIDCLLLPPLIADLSPWQKGLFKKIAETHVTQTDLKLNPTFAHPLNGKLFNQDGKPATQRGLVTGEWAVCTHSGAASEILDALGLDS